MSMRSQVSMEFLTFIMFLFVVTIIFFIGMHKYKLNVYDKERYMLSRDIGLKVHGELLLAMKAREGFSRNFTIPDKLIGTVSYDYNMTIKNYTLIVLCDGNEVDFPSPIQNASLNMGGINTISKKDGILKIE